MWNQKKAMKIHDCKNVAELFCIGSNWNDRIISLKKGKDSRSDELILQLERRVDFIYSFIDTHCSHLLVMTPDWYYDRRMKPFREEMKKQIENDKRRTV